MSPPRGATLAPTRPTTRRKNPARAPTFGGGGHSQGILDALGPDGRLFGFDCDPDAEPNVPEDSRFTLIPENFRFSTRRDPRLNIPSTFFYSFRTCVKNAESDMFLDKEEKIGDRDRKKNRNTSFTKRIESHRTNPRLS